MRPLIEKFCIRAGRNFLRRGQRGFSANFPGSIRVAEFEVTDLKPLGGFFQPGVTKAGRLSFAGYCNGRKVKVYSAQGSAQIALRQAVQNIDFSVCAFPELIAVDENLVVEAWVEGRSVEALGSSARRGVEQDIRVFLEANLLRGDLRNLARQHAGAFCYFEDYLVSRLGTWIHWSLVGSFLASWKKQYDELSKSVPVYLSHPDLSAANLVVESGTGKLVIVDNELLGVGLGWIIDGRNSLLRADIDCEVLSQIPKDFLDFTWRLRKIGSALDASDFYQVKALCSK